MSRTASGGQFQPLLLLGFILLAGGLLASSTLARQASKFSLPAPPQARPADVDVSNAGVIVEPATVIDSYLFALEVGGAVAVENRDHAVIKHGLDAQKIRSCLNKNGPDEVWAFTSWRRANHFIQTCKLDDGRWGLRIIQGTKAGRWLERTSFIVKNGTKQELREYVTARAVRFTGNLLDIVL